MTVLPLRWPKSHTDRYKMQEEQLNPGGEEDIVEAANAVIRGYFLGYFDQGDCEEEERAITYFSQKLGTLGKYWVLSTPGFAPK